MTNVYSLHSSHPYLFFNQDGSTMTFMGLWIDEDGNLVDFKNETVIEKKFITKDLRERMKANAVQFKEEYEKWEK